MNWSLTDRKSRKTFARYITITIMVLSIGLLIAIISTALPENYAKTTMEMIAGTLLLWVFFRLFRVCFGVQNTFPSSGELLRTAKLQRGFELKMDEASKKVWKEEFVPFKEWTKGAKFVLIFMTTLTFLSIASFILAISNGEMELDWNKAVLVPFWGLMFLVVYLIYGYNSRRSVEVDSEWPEYLEPLEKEE